MDLTVEMETIILIETVEFQGAGKKLRGSVLVATGSDLKFLADDVVLLISLDRDRQLSLEWFIAECKAVRIRTLQVQLWGAISGSGPRSCPKRRGTRALGLS